jgi:hypothetical protein
VKVREVVAFDLFMKTKTLHPILAVAELVAELEVELEVELLLHVKFQ